MQDLKTELDKMYVRRKELIENKENEKVIELENEITGKLLDVQRNEYETKLKYLGELKKNKGNSAAIFKLKAKVTGEKKVKQEAVCMVDPSSGEMIFEPEKIKEASVEYLKDLLTNRKPKKEYEKDITVKEIIHEVRMKEAFEEDETFTEADFSNLLKQLKLKNKDKYQFILKAGKDYLRILHSLFSKIWIEEKKPKQWNLTTAHQLFKGKGNPSEFKNQRFIHTKNENPKAFEHVIMMKAKPKIVDVCSVFQI